MRSGYVKLHWKTKDSLVGTSAVATGIWAHLLLRATFKRRLLNNGQVLEPGQLVISERGLADDLQVSRKMLRAQLEVFEADGMIRFDRRDRSGTTLTICNWATYQSEWTEPGPTGDQPGTAKEPKGNRKGTQTKKPKKPKKPKTNTASASGFDEWWAVYPRKTAKEAARKSYAKACEAIAARGSPESADPGGYLLSRVRLFAESDAGRAGEFTPHPTTWLNQGRYDDDSGTWKRGGGSKIGAGQQYDPNAELVW